MPKREISKIAVWNSAFLGDAILTLPLLQSLRLNYPGAAIDFYTRRGFSGLFRAHPAVSGACEYDKAQAGKSLSATLAYGGKLKVRGYELWISAHQSLRSAMLSRCSRAGTRIGYDSPSFLGLNRYFYTHRVPRRFGELHEVERLLQLLGPLDLKELSTWPELRLPSEDLAGAELFFGALAEIAAGAALPPRPVLGLHPGSVWGTKRWPVEYFAVVGANALRRGAQVLIFAGPGEDGVAGELFRQILGDLQISETCRPPEFVESLLSMKGISPEGRFFRPGGGEGIGPACINLAAALSLPELAAFIGRLSCYVSNDSGPMHMAWIQRVPLVAIFGPTVSGLGFSPRGASSLLLETELDCRPCGLHGPRVCPKGHHGCMRLLTPEKVWPEVERKLFDQSLLK